jgi:NAD(P)-dependent dehydrogenase (short-subunit alcohol dehydrogenase family)
LLQVASVTGGSLDVLINNGAYLDSSTMMTMPSQLSDPDIIDHVRDVTLQSVEANVFGAINLTNYFLPLIERGTEKKIVHTTTGLSEPDFTLATGIPGLVPYTGSKAMMNVIIAKYGVELRPKDIHIVAISPGWVETSPLPEEGLAWIGSCFRKVDPNVKARIQPEESVRHQLDTISKLGWDVQGRMISHHGDRNWF